MSAEAALARRYYLHVKNGSHLNERDLSRMVQAIEKRDAEIQRLRDWIKAEGDRTDTCTHSVLREVCSGCRCGRAA